MGVKNPIELDTGFTCTGISEAYRTLKKEELGMECCGELSLLKYVNYSFAVNQSCGCDINFNCLEKDFVKCETQEPCEDGFPVSVKSVSTRCADDICGYTTVITFDDYWTPNQLQFKYDINPPVEDKIHYLYANQWTRSVNMLSDGRTQVVLTSSDGATFISFVNKINLIYSSNREDEYIEMMAGGTMVLRIGVFPHTPININYNDNKIDFIFDNLIPEFPCKQIGRAYTQYNLFLTSFLLPLVDTSELLTSGIVLKSYRYGDDIINNTGSISRVVDGVTETINLELEYPFVRPYCRITDKVGKLYIVNDDGSKTLIEKI